MFGNKGPEKLRPRTLLREAKHLYGKKKYRLDDETRETIEKAIEELEARIKSGEKEAINEAKERLYDEVTRHIPRSGSDVFLEYTRALITAILIALVVRQFVIEPFRIPTGSMIPTLNVGDKILVSKFTYGLTIPFTRVKIADFHKPKRWDVVVFTTGGIEDASAIEKNFVKRIVGLPGETIEIREGDIYRHEVNSDGVDVATLMEKPSWLKEFEPRYLNYQNFDANKVSQIDLYDEDKVMGILPTYNASGESRVVKWKYGKIGQQIKIPAGHYFVLGDNSFDSFDSRGWGFVPFENIRGKVICKWKFLPPWGDGIVR